MRFDNITKIAGLLSCAAALPLTSVAQEWQLIDDFESYTEISYQTNGDPALVYPGASNGGRGFMDIWGTDDGIEGVGGTQAAHFWFGIVDDDLGDFWHQIPLPEEIPLDETGTVYWRMWQDGYQLNWHVMLSKVAAGEEPQSTALWNSQATILRINGNDPIDIEARDGTAYVHSSPPQTPALETWYEFWMVTYNGVGDAGHYEVYRRAPGETEPQLLTWDAGQGATKTELQFRNKAESSIKTLVFARNSEFPASDLYLVDDIYFSEGENLTTPGGEEPTCDNPWADWCDDDADGWVDTGSFLGQIWYDGSGWIYVASMEQWIYLPEDMVGDTGAWSYLPR